MHVALEVELAGFSDGSGRGTASLHVVDSEGLICAQSSIRYTNGRISSGAMEMAGMVMALDMVTIYVEMLAPGQRLHVWFYCDNIPIVEYAVAPRAGLGTIARDEHLTYTNGLLANRRDALRRAGHVLELGSSEIT